MIKITTYRRMSADGKFFFCEKKPRNDHSIQDWRSLSSLLIWKGLRTVFLGYGSFGAHVSIVWHNNPVSARKAVLYGGFLNIQSDRRRPLITSLLFPLQSWADGQVLPLLSFTASWAIENHTPLMSLSSKCSKAEAYVITHVFLLSTAQAIFFGPVT